MKFIRLFHEILREIFDETAYERFCSREGLEVDAESYAKFLTLTAKSCKQKIRCC
jgi:hypothetical protein